MAFNLCDWTWETTTTTGTGDYSLAGAVTNYRAFSAGLANGDTTYVSVFDGTNFEEGLYTYTSSTNTLARTTVYRSTNSNNAVNWGAGTKQIMAAQLGVTLQSFLTPGSTGFPNRTADNTWSYYNTTGSGTTVVLSAGPTISGTLSTANQTITSTSANALAVGRQGTTSPAFNVDASTASSATGLNVKAAAAGGGVAVAAISSGTNENLTLDAKGSGTITVGGTSTGAITLTRATTMSAALTYGGVTLSNSVTGTGSMVLSAAPALTGNTTVGTINSLTITTSTGTLTITNGKTLSASNSLTLAGTDGTTMTFPGASANVGYLEIPQNAQTGNYTTLLSDSGKHIYHAAGAGAAIYTIDSNNNAPYPVGATLTFINYSTNNVTISITTDTLVLSPGGSTGSRTLAQYGIATAIKITSTVWLISGTGLT